MTNKDLFEALRTFEKEKGIPMDYMLQNIEKAISVACKNYYGGNENVVFKVDPEKNSFDAKLVKTVVDEVFDPNFEVTVEEAQQINKRKKFIVGDEIEVPIDPKHLGWTSVSSARNVAVFDTIAALLAAFVIIPGMAAGGAELSSGGPGLMFIYLVNVFNGMPGGKIVGIVFYVCVLFAGMSSLVNLYEAPVATIQEKLKLNRVASVGIIAVAGCVVSLVIQGIVSGWMDAVSIYICPLGAMLAAIMFFWVAGKKFAVDAVNAGADKPIGKWFVPLGKYVLVPLSLVALIAGALLGGIG